MTDTEMQEKAVEIVRASQAKLEPQDMQIRSKVKEFLDGTLFIVHWYSNTQAKENQNYVYFKGDNPILIYTAEELAKWMSNYEPERGISKALRTVFSLSATAGLIALIITITICWMSVIKVAEKPPDILANALTTILGFYFGSQVTKK
ncbi:MAG TPA: hypothetical protein VN228_15250 [Pyrinomonadaceae bacterium]|nr:hypothetical protein [Pyrinomonadaceae bacterium]